MSEAQVREAVSKMIAAMLARVNTQRPEPDTACGRFLQEMEKMGANVVASFQWAEPRGIRMARIQLLLEKAATTTDAKKPDVDARTDETNEMGDTRATVTISDNTVKSVGEIKSALKYSRRGERGWEKTVNVVAVRSNIGRRTHCTIALISELCRIER